MRAKFGLVAHRSPRAHRPQRDHVVGRDGVSPATTGPPLNDPHPDEPRPGTAFSPDGDSLSKAMVLSVMPTILVAGPETAATGGPGRRALAHPAECCLVAGPHTQDGDGLASARNLL